MRRPIALIFSLLLTVAVIGGVAGSVTAAPGAGSAILRSAAITASQYAPDSEECAFLSIINDYRRQNGLGDLKLSPTLGAAAEHHSIDMANKNYFSHTLSDGTTWSQNIINHGYDYRAMNTYVAENIAAGNATASATFTQWKNSSGHNANMLSTKYKAIGIGRAYNSSSTYKWYWTTTFGGVVDATISCSGGSNPTPTPTPAPDGGSAYTIVRSGRTSYSTNSTYAYDGNASTAWYTTRSTPPSYAYVWFDLGSARSVGAIKWLFSQTGSADRFKIQVSNDRSTWRTISTLGNAPANSWQTLSWSGSTRYVRFYFENPNRDAVLGYLAEVQITR